MYLGLTVHSFKICWSEMNHHVYMYITVVFTFSSWKQIGSLIQLIICFIFNESAYFNPLPAHRIAWCVVIRFHCSEIYRSGREHTYAARAMDVNGIEETIAGVWALYRNENLDGYLKECGKENNNLLFWFHVQSVNQEVHKRTLWILGLVLIYCVKFNNWNRDKQLMFLLIVSVRQDALFLLDCSFSVECHKF